MSHLAFEYSPKNTPAITNFTGISLQLKLYLLLREINLMVLFMHVIVAYTGLIIREIQFTY